MQRRIFLLPGMALSCALLVLAITTLSAFIRLSGPQAACEPQPQCRTVAVETPGATPFAGVRGAARIAHRLAASAALLVIIGMLVTVFRAGGPTGEPGRLLLALLAAALFLAVLGRMAGASQAPAVVLANLLAGFAMVGLSWRLAAVVLGRAAPGGGLRWTALALLAAAAATGGFASLAGGGLASPLHQVVGAIAAAVLALAGAAAWRRGRRAGAVLLALVVLEVIAGAVSGPRPPVLLALAHNVLAALLVAVAASLA